MKLHIGSVVIHSLVEIEAGHIIQSGLPEATPDAVRAIPWLQPEFATDGNLKAVIQSFIVETLEHRILVDTCNGNRKHRTDLPEWNNLQLPFLEQMQGIGLTPEDIDIVLNTHMHCDHVGWNTRLVDGAWVPTFPNAIYLMVQKEYDYWTSPLDKEVNDDRAAFADSVQPIVTAGKATFVDSNYAITSTVSLFPTHGHTPGHVSVLIEDSGERAVITGDVLYSPCQIAHPEWGTPFDTDTKVATETRRKFLSDCADTKTVIVGSHFPPPTCGTIKTSNEGFWFDTNLSR